MVGNKQDLDAHVKTCKPSQGRNEVIKAQPPQLEQKKPEKVQLTYVFKGQCPTCANQLNTLEIDIEKKHFCIAFCGRCNKQIESREVVKL